MIALVDGKISDEKFRLILSEVDNYNRQKQGIGLSEAEQKELIRRGSEEAIMYLRGRPSWQSELPRPIKIRPRMYVWRSNMYKTTAFCSPEEYSSEAR